VLLVRPREDESSPTAEEAFRHILIPLDGSTLAEQIVPFATALGTPMKARYTLLQVVEPVTLGYAPYAAAAGLDQRVLDEMRAAAHAYLEGIAQRLRSQGAHVNTRVVLGPPAAAILEYAGSHGVDLVALETHGRGGLARLLLGSVADKIVRGAGIPVLLHRPENKAS
jgi:nucleotide-binding universal stress UspA family protein